MKSEKRRIAKGLIGLVLLFSLARVAHAGDTLELWDLGVSDFELFLAYAGAGKNEPERGVGAETLLGIGITGWLSAYLSASGEANEELGEGTGAFGFGVFATALDTDHFDFDIGFDVTIGNLGPGEEGPAGHSQADVGFTPFVELNLDSDPDLNGFGAYVFLEYGVGGRDESFLDPMGEEVRDFTITRTTNLTVGAYYTVCEGHQAFLSHDLAFNHTPEAGDRHTEVGGVALGYNFFVVPDVLEIITEVNFDIPQDGEDFGADFLLGFIATLSAGG